MMIDVSLRMVLRLLVALFFFYCHLIVKPNNLSRFQLNLNMFSALIERMVIAQISRDFFFSCSKWTAFVVFVSTFFDGLLLGEKCAPDLMSNFSSSSSLVNHSILSSFDHRIKSHKSLCKLISVCTSTCRGKLPLLLDGERCVYQSLCGPECVLAIIGPVCSTVVYTQIVGLKHTY